MKLFQNRPRPRRFSTAGRKPASSSRRRRPAVEVLEAYRLLSTLVVDEFPVATSGAHPYEIVAGPDGNLWFSEEDANQIGMVDVKTGAVSEFPDGEPAGTGTTGITVGTDGNIWFVSKPDNINADGPDDIGMINPTTHATAAYPVTAPDLGPLNITAGPDGDLWFTQPLESRVGILDPTTGAVTEINDLVDYQIHEPWMIQLGPDGNMWFTDDQSDEIGTINATTHVITEFPLPSGATDPSGMTFGPDGDLWFALVGEVGKIDPTSHAISTFSLNQKVPVDLAVGPDGQIWFTEDLSDHIGSIDPTTGTVTQHATTVTESDDLVTGSDGNLWFTENSANAVGQASLGRVTTTSRSPTPTPTPTLPLAPTPTPSPTTTPQAPQLGGVAGISGRGGVTTILLTFDEPLDPGSAADPAVYGVFAGVKSHHRTVFTKRLAIKRVALQGGGTQVAITLKKPARGRWS